MNLRQRKHCAKTKIVRTPAEVAVHRDRLDKLATKLESGFVGRTLGAMIGSMIGEKIAATPGGLENALQSFIDPTLAERQKVIAYLKSKGFAVAAEGIGRGEHL